MKASNILIFAAVLAAFLPSALAQANRTSEVSGFHFTGDTFELKEDLYVVHVNSYDEVILTHGEEYYVVRNGTCTKKNIYYQFCVEGIEYDTDEHEMKADLRVYSREPEITITRTASSTSLIMGGNATITAKLENTGHTKAHNVTYTDTFPEEINITVPPEYRSVLEVRRNRKVIIENGSAVYRHTLFWQDELDPGESVEFMYEIVPKKPLDREFSARIHYFDGYEEVDEYSDGMNLIVEPYLELRTAIIDKNYRMPAGTINIESFEKKSPVMSGEDMLLIVDLVNNYDNNKTNVNVSELRFFLPNGIRYIGPASFRIYDNASDENSSFITGGISLSRVTDRLYRWSGRVSKAGKTFVLKLKGAKKGVHNIRVAGDFRREGLPTIHDYSSIETFEVTRKDIEIESNFEENDRFTSGQEEYFTMYLVNPNNYVNFTNVNVSLEAPWLESRKYQHFNKIKAFGYQDILNKVITMPTVTRTETFDMKARVNYTTDMGETLNETFERTITVYPVIDLEVTHEISGSSIDNSGKAEIDNEETEITLKVFNELEKDLEGVTITEVFDKELNSKGRISNKFAFLKRDSESEIYTYMIDPPDKVTRQNFTITTYVAYRLGNQTYNTSFDIDLTVKPKEMDISVIKDVFEKEIIRGQYARFSYKIRNTEDEPVKNVTLHFPLQRETDLVGARNFTIDEILPGETVNVNNEETVRMKLNGTVRVENTRVTFRDNAGNLFEDESTIRTVDVLDGTMEAPAIFLNMTAPENVTEGDNFTVDVVMINRGALPSAASVSYAGEQRKIRAVPDKENQMRFNLTADQTGFFELPRAVANYTYNGLDHYTASNIQTIYSKSKKEFKEPEVEEEKEEIIEEVEKDKGIKFNVKYLYLAAFIIIVSLIILYILKKPKKEEGFEFIER